MPAAYDLSTVIGGSQPVSHNNLIPIGTTHTSYSLFGQSQIVLEGNEVAGMYLNSCCRTLTYWYWSWGGSPIRRVALIPKNQHQKHLKSCEKCCFQYQQICQSLYNLIKHYYLKLLAPNWFTWSTGSVTYLKWVILCHSQTGHNTQYTALLPLATTK